MVDLLRRYDLPPDRLTIEVTEQACSIDPSAVRDTFDHALLASACASASTTSASATRRSHASRSSNSDQLKIDRSFVTDAMTQPTDRYIIEFAVQLADSLGIQVVAEGVESAEVLALAHRARGRLRGGLPPATPDRPRRIATLFGS